MKTKDIFPKPLIFEWDKGNVDKNLKKHNIKNEEAEEIFFDDLSLLTEDSKHSKIEERYQLLGKSGKGNRLNVIFTVRETKVRIISARPMNRKERKLYD